MNAVVVSLALLAAATTTSDETSNAKPATVAKASPPKRIGQIFVVGNEITRQDVILKDVNLVPGQVLYYSDLAAAQRNVARLGIFKPGSVQVTAEDDPNNPHSEYKNVFINIEETCTSSVYLMPTVSVLGKPVVSVVWEERNFDPLRFPTSRDDLLGGGAFRGRGMYLRLELLQIPVVP